MAATSIKISGLPFPFALKSGTPNGTEVVPADQTVSSVRSTLGFTVASLFGSLSITYPTGAVSANFGGAAITGSTFTAYNTGTNASLRAKGLNSASAGVVSFVDGQTGNHEYAIAAGVSGAGTFTIRDVTNSNADRITISAAGNVVVNAPSSGTGLSVSSASGQTGAIITTPSDGQLILDTAAGGRFSTLSFNIAGAVKNQIFWDNTTGIMNFGARTSVVSGVVSAANGVNVTLQTLANTGYGTYLVSATISGANDAPNYSTTYLVQTNAASSKIIALQTAPNVVVSLSGLTVQALQASGATNPISYTITRIA